MKYIHIHFVRNGLINILFVAISFFATTACMELIIRYRVVTVLPLTVDGSVDVRELAKDAALARGEPYDERRVDQVITTARAQGQRAYPTVSPSYFMTERDSSVVINQQPVLPMGINALANTYYCNESGQYAIFSTDRYGFRNPDSAWVRSPDIITVGDSFTMGSCLNTDDTIVGNLRRGGRTVLNLGMGANGPLIELGSLIEYGHAAKPKTVLWLFFPNDLDDLVRESKNNILKQYLKPGFTQHLIDHSEELNSSVDSATEQYWLRTQEVLSLQSKAPPHSFFEFSNLKHLYQLIRRRYLTSHEAQRPNLTLFLNIIKRANEESRSMGANLYFVYLPDCDASSYGQNLWKAELLASVQRLGIAVIDTEPAINESAREGKGAWFYCPGSHFNPSGAQTAAEQIANRLSEASNSNSKSNM